MTPTEAPKPHILEVEFSRPLHWLVLAWQDMARCPVIGLTHGFLLATAGAAMFWAAGDRFWWMAAMISGFMLITPILACGLYEVSRRLERGEQPRWAHVLEIWCSKDRRLITFGVLLSLSCIGWVMCSAMLIHWMMPASVHTPIDFLRLVVLRPELGLFELWLLLGTLLCAPIFASSVVAIPLLLDQPVSVMQAVYVSWRVVALNPIAMAFWAALLTLFTSLGLASLFIGLMGVVPMLGHASWHAYRDLVKMDLPYPVELLDRG